MHAVDLNLGCSVRNLVLFLVFGELGLSENFFFNFLLGIMELSAWGSSGISFLFWCV